MWLGAISALSRTLEWVRYAEFELNGIWENWLPVGIGGRGRNLEGAGTPDGVGTEVRGMNGEVKGINRGLTGGRE